ncbi:MAG: cytochrome B [Novosphingobium sp. SCN 63-17]|nr:MAG: cytochrome B [Novosphingobium sp. SCN 63-17]OJX96755.1 MAG: cytochrome B [Novosphingobium sp. 63-713]
MSAMEPVNRYPLAMRLLHWLRAGLILGLIAVGFTMTSLPDTASIKFTTLYPMHKEFGVLVWLIVVVQLAIRWQSRLPQPPAGLKPWEAHLSHVVHVAMLVLAFVVPLMGYSMSASFTQSDGVPFFGLEVPELLPKNDKAFAVFQLLHKVLAYTLLGLVGLHVAGVFKHRFLDADKANDVLPRML